MRRARDREADEEVPGDDLEGASSERCDAARSPRLPRVDRTVARRQSGAAYEDRQASRERPATGLCPRAAVRGGPAPGRHDHPRTARPVAQEVHTTPLSGPSLGALIESRADLAALGGRLPR